MATKLTCADVERRIDQLLDDRLTLTGDSLLMAHAMTCEECSELINDYQIFACATSELPPHKVSVVSSERVGIRRRKHTGTLVSVAAILLFCIGLFSISDSARTGTDSLASRPSTSGISSPLAMANPVAPGKELRNQVIPATGTKSDDIFLYELVYFQPPTIVELAQTTPALVDSFRRPKKSNWQRFTESLDPLNPYLQMSAEFPGMRNFQNSWNVTLNLLNQSMAKPEEDNPDLGYFPDAQFFAAI